MTSAQPIWFVVRLGSELRRPRLRLSQAGMSSGSALTCAARYFGTSEQGCRPTRLRAAPPTTSAQPTWVVVVLGSSSAAHAFALAELGCRPARLWAAPPTTSAKPSWDAVRLGSELRYPRRRLSRAGKSPGSALSCAALDFDSDELGCRPARLTSAPPAIYCDVNSKHFKLLEMSSSNSRHP